MVRKTNEQSLGKVLSTVIDELRLNDKINEQKIISSWKKVMGANISKYTEKIVFSKTVLIVYLKSAPLREELNFAKSRIIKNINKEFDSEIIKDILFR